MDAAQTALARHHTYTLLSRLFLDGITPELMPYVEAIPPLDTALPRPVDFDEAAATHYRLFGLNLFPYESVFLDPAGLLGGPITDAVLRTYSESRFRVGDDATSPDHVGHELALLAFLSGAEADAWEDELPDPAGRMRARQRDFLQTHLLPWLPPFLVALRRQEHALYTALAELTLDLVRSHAGALVEDAPAGQTNFTLPDPPTLLEDEDTGLKEIAGFLLTPPYSGIFLGREDVAQLARSRELPRGFGDRQQMLTNLLRSAAQYEALDDLLQTLRDLCREWEQAYETMAAQPALAPYATVWQARAAATGGILAGIERMIEEEG